MIPTLVGALGVMRVNRAGQRSRSVHEDWFAWIPNEMDELFAAIRNDLESSDVILSITLNEALALCKQGHYDFARERVFTFSGLLDRLADRICHVVHVIKDHGSHFGTLPNVKPLSPGNFRGANAQRVSIMNGLLAKVVFRQRTRFFHKLSSLDEIIVESQKEAHALLSEIAEGVSPFPDRAWQQLEILGYDLNICMGEATVLLKSFFCALPPDELESFRKKLVSPVPGRLQMEPGRVPNFGNK